ncbi:MAG: gamma carbonic anhydrase family protein [Verrucomicrobiales bacterium]|nr:gamma carbonic anhydrase family protein [Verrucomicrobiales bacterium]|tara:strand:+ start:1378 stop:1947 length:570 start_codon:yes stop_codon:yes gene_type:complete
MSSEREEHFARLERHLGKLPKVGDGSYIASGATVMGDVTLGQKVSIWPGTVLRGDINRIEIGDFSNVQDNTVVHLSDDYGAIIGQWTTIGHSAVVHACTIGDECLVGMGSVILDGAEIGNQCIVGANATVTGGTKVPDGSLVLGSPAKIVKPLSEEQRKGLKWWAEKYVWNAEYYLRNKINVGAPFPRS